MMRWATFEERTDANVEQRAGGQRHLDPHPNVARLRFPRLHAMVDAQARRRRPQSRFFRVPQKSGNANHTLRRQSQPGDRARRTVMLPLNSPAV